MRKRLHASGMAFLCGVLLLAACRSSAPTAPHGTSPVVAAYLDEIIMVMEANSINRMMINWRSFRDQVMDAAAGAQSVEDAHPGIQKALQLLGDNHSFYISAQNDYLYAGVISCPILTYDPPDVPESIAYVKVGTFGGSSTEAQLFSTAIQQAIEAEDQKNPIGWIVDLRGNRGGNMWPMLAGIGPVLGNGIVGHFVDPLGVAGPWSYHNGEARFGTSPLHTVPAPYSLQVAAPRVAVLTDGSIASSGEAIVIAFKGRPDTRSFGSETCGLSTANSVFYMSDGAQLNLAVSVMADRTRYTYGGPVFPDEVVADPQLVIERAVDWLEASAGSGL